MLINQLRLLVPAILGLTLTFAGEAKADFIGDVVTITSDSLLSGDPTTTSVMVATPTVELPSGFGSQNLAENLSIDIEARSIEVIFNSGVFLNSSEFNGLRFTSLDSPGEIITGFSITSSVGGVSGFIDPSAVTFGSNFVDVNLQNTGAVSYSRGDRVLITLQLSPVSAVPEPSSVVMLGLGALGLVGWKLRRHRAA